MASGNVYDRLVKLFAPSIWEMEDIKRGVLCQLFGGTTGNNSNNNNNINNTGGGGRKRGRGADLEGTEETEEVMSLYS